jgi:hypothetical protein
VTHRECDIVVGSKLARRFGIERKARYRALAALERAGLITVTRGRGRSPRVAILQMEEYAGIPAEGQGNNSGGSNGLNVQTCG